MPPRSLRPSPRLVSLGGIREQSSGLQHRLLALGEVLLRRDGRALGEALHNEVRRELGHVDLKMVARVDPIGVATEWWDRSCEPALRWRCKRGQLLPTRRLARNMTSQALPLFPLLVGLENT